MAILKKSKVPRQRLQIDLTGPDGNAFVLQATAINLARQLGLDSLAILREMRISDYEHLIQVFDKHFGDHVDLLR